MKAALALLAAIVLMSSAATAEIKVRPFVIDDDGGGMIGTYMDLYWRLKQSGIPVVLDGKCVSACTLVLHLPPEQVCATPRAELGFHRPTSDEEGITAKDIAEFARGVYPPSIAEMYLKLKFNKRNDPVFKNAVALGVRPCAADIVETAHQEEQD